MSKILVTASDADLNEVKALISKYADENSKAIAIDSEVEANEALSKDSKNKLDILISSIEETVKDVIEIESKITSDKPVKKEEEITTDAPEIEKRETLFTHESDLEQELQPAASSTDETSEVKPDSKGSFFPHI